MAKTKTAKAPVTKTKTGDRTAVERTGGVPRSVKFRTYSQNGDALQYVLCNAFEVAVPAVAEAPVQTKVAHLVLIVDRSGSMYGQIEGMRAEIKKLLAVDEYKQDANFKVSLYTYSSQGDCREEFIRSPISQVNARNSAEQRAIDRITASCMTCASQALEAAVDALDPDETTCIVLHTDGYFNDPSSASEERKLTRLAASLAEKNAYLNTVCHGWGDVRLLGTLATTGGGTAVKSGTLAEVYNAMYASAAKLRETCSEPAQLFPLPKGFNCQVVTGSQSKRVACGQADLLVPALAPGEATVYQFKFTDEAEYDKSAFPAAQRGKAAYALARAALAAGRLNVAKTALLASEDVALVKRYRDALDQEDLGAFAAELDALLIAGDLTGREYAPAGEDDRVSVMGVINTLKRHMGDFLVDPAEVYQAYQRRGLKSRQGKWVVDDAGEATFEPNPVRAVALSGQLAKPTAFETNRNTATVNLRVVQDVVLENIVTGKTLKYGDDLGGVPAPKLQTYRQFTLVGDGRVCTPRLPIRINTQPMYNALRRIGAVTKADGKDGFFAGETYVVSFENRPVVTVDDSGSHGVTRHMFDRLLSLAVMMKFLNALKSGDPDNLSPEAKEAYKAWNLTPAGYFSAPSANPYPPAPKGVRLKKDNPAYQDFVQRGLIDFRKGYVISIGTVDVASLDLPSGNELFRKYFSLTVDKKPVPTKETTLRGWFEGVTGGKSKVAVSARHESDTALATVVVSTFMQLMGEKKLLRDTSSTLTTLGAHELVSVLGCGYSACEDASEAQSAIDQAARLVADQFDDLYRTSVQPYVFTTGASGMTPAKFDVPGLTHDDLTTQYPELAAQTKAADEATYYVAADGMVLTVMSETIEYSTSLDVG